MRKRLFSCISFEKFPPESMFIYGWSWQLWEGLLAYMDANLTFLFLRSVSWWIIQRESVQQHDW